MTEADATTEADGVRSESGPKGEDVPSVELDVARERARQALFGQRQASRKVGRFTLLEPVGRGGMGTVYAAYDPQLDRKIAIKLLSVGRNSADQTTPRRRMLAEARAMAKVSHPNVVAVYEVGVVDDDEPAPSIFVAMEFIAGQTLRQWVADHRPDWRQVVEVYEAAGRGLQAVHAAGLVHRDFKPDNVMRDEDGRVRVMDFGLARDEGLDVPGGPGPSAAASFIGNLTKTGALLGTPAYMAPEQFQGEVADALADQYAFCVSLYEALWGKRPYTARTPLQMVTKVLEDEQAPAPPRSGVPGRIRRAVMRGLLRDPSQRWPSMEALLAELHPRSTGRRVATGVFGLGLLGALLWAGSAARQPPPCQGADEAFASTWNDARRDQLVTALSRPERTIGPAAASAIADRLDGYADRWLAQHQDACAATRLRGEQSEARMDQRMACLDRRQSDFDALVDVLAEGDTEAALQADHAVDALPSPDRCADPAFLDATIEPPAAPEVAAQVSRLRDQIARGRALHRVGSSTEALALLEPLAVEAASVDYPPIQIEAEAAKATVALSLSTDFHPIIEQLEHVYFAARETRLPLVAASAALEIASMRSTADAEIEQATHWLRLATAEVRAHGLTDLDFMLADVEGSIALADGRYGDAIEMQLRSLQTQRERCGEACPALGETLESLATLYDHVDDNDLALRYATEALEYERRRHRDGHPHLAGPLLRLGEAQASLGRYEEAIPNLERAVEIRERELGPSHVNALGPRMILGAALVEAGRVDEGLSMLERTAETARDADVPAAYANILNRLASAYDETGQQERARAAYQEAATTMTRLHPGPHPAHGVLQSNIALTFAQEDRNEEALVGFRNALSLHEALGQPPGKTTVPYLINIGKTLLDLQRPTEAVEPLATASALVADQTVSPRIVDLELSLARAMSASDREAARAVVDNLVERCASLSAEHRKAATCDRIAAWRDEHDL